MSFIVLRGIEKNLSKKHNPKLLFKDIDSEYGRANKIFFGK